MANRILILHGPNLNLLGQREPEVYGSQTLDDVDAACRSLGADLGLEVETFQSNHEGELVDRLQQAGRDGIGVVFNPGAYSHTSIALRDAIAGANTKVVEVHVTNVHAREAFRHHSHVSAVASGVICGLGTNGYLLAIRALATNGNNDENNNRGR